MKAVIVWFVKNQCHYEGPYQGKPIVAFRTAEEDEADARKHFDLLMQTYDLRANLRLTHPNIILEDHPHYQYVIEAAEIWPEG